MLIVTATRKHTHAQALNESSGPKRKHYAERQNNCPHRQRVLERRRGRRGERGLKVAGVKVCFIDTQKVEGVGVMKDKSSSLMRLKPCTHRWSVGRSCPGKREAERV
jgi:hypothetical protein